MARYTARLLRRAVSAERRAVVAERRARDLARAMESEAPPCPEYVGDFLFVVTFGRSGSTLLQSHLNALPGWTIRGENGDAATQYVASAQRALTAMAERGVRKVDSGSPWFGFENVSGLSLVNRTRALIVEEFLQPQPGTRVLGFKEIRWEIAPLGGFLTFMRDVFPGARFIVNLRDPDAAAASGWWRSTPGAAETLRDRAAVLRQAADELGDAAFVVHYEDYAMDPSRLGALMDWLGEEFVLRRHVAVAANRLTH